MAACLTRLFLSRTHHKENRDHAAHLVPEEGVPHNSDLKELVGILSLPRTAARRRTLSLPLGSRVHHLTTRPVSQQCTTQGFTSTGEQEGVSLWGGSGLETP